MPTVKTKDGVDSFYKDWGSGQPILFSHGWPLSSDDWDTQMLFFLQHGIVLSRMTGAGMDAQLRLETDTTWTTMPMIWRP